MKSKKQPVINANADTTVSSQLQTIITNLVKTAQIRNEKLEGRDYLVVPMVMLVEGVLNGSNGPLFYPKEELAKVPQVWNHKPVVVYHPTMNGKALSACDPEVIEAYKVGIIMNTSFDGKRLKSEAWLEPSRLEKIDNRVLEAVNNKQMMEVSTGLFTENETISGNFNGTAYDAIARNFRPDHLAILPDKIGACSIADGAGLLRVNSQNSNEINSLLGMLNIDSDISHDEIRHSLYSLLGDNKHDVWIEDVFDTWFVYSAGSGILFKQEYEIKDGGTALKGTPQRVEKKIIYEAKIVSNSNEGEKKMTKEEMVKELIANGSKWTKEDEKMLMSMNEEQLGKLAPEAPKTDPVIPKVPEAPKEPVKNEKPADLVLEKPAAVSAADYLKNAPLEIREVLNDAMMTQSQKKAELIGVITSNKKNLFTKDNLSAMSVNELNAIAALAQTQEETQSLKLNYSGQGNGGALENATKEEPLMAPVMNFAKKTK